MRRGFWDACPGGERTHGSRGNGAREAAGCSQGPRPRSGGGAGRLPQLGGPLCEARGPSALAHVAADPAALCCLQSVPSVSAPLLIPSVDPGHLGGLPFWARNAAVRSVLWGPPAAGELLGDVASKGATGHHPRRGPASSPALGALHLFPFSPSGGGLAVPEWGFSFSIFLMTSELARHLQSLLATWVSFVKFQSCDCFLWDSQSFSCREGTPPVYTQDTSPWPLACVVSPLGLAF